MKDGIALTSTPHPKGDPVPDEIEINPDSLETAEIEIPMSIKEINEAFDREYEKHIKDLDESNFVKIKMPTYYIAKHSDEDLQAAVLAEREACIKLLEDFSKTGMVPVKDTWRMGLIAGANAIRARKDK